MNKTFSCAEVQIPFGDAVKLRSEGRLNLGLSDDFSAALANKPELGPTNKGANLAFLVWNAVGLIVMGASIVLSFLWQWWAFLGGLLLAYAIFKANRKSHSENYLDAAFTDKDFYERVQQLGEWHYQMSEDDAAAYKIG
jgi:hypothetical protein